jgi:hypothetical protein
VWLDGFYGTPTRRRRRYRCAPADGEPAHRFVEPLPHQDGRAAAPRSFTYTSREIAAALVAVGRGSSYRAAAAGVDGNSVADWVEVFAPLVFSRSAPEAWPRVVAIAGLDVHVRAPDVRGVTDAPTYRIAAALGGADEILALQAYPGAAGARAQAHWADFLRSLAGAPERVVLAPDPDLLRAATAVWRAVPETFLCQSRLRDELLAVLHDEGVGSTQPLARAAARAFRGAASWREFLDYERPRRLRRLERWLARNGEQIARQLERSRRFDATTDALTRRLDELGDSLATRRGSFRNRERTNRLLMLVQLELNGLADARRYTRIIEEELLARGGRPDARRAIVDAGRASLRP